MSDVEETLKRINSHKGVLGIVIVNTDTGVAIRSTLDEKMSKIISGEVGHLCMKAKHAVRSLDPQNDLTYVRVNSKKYEMLVAPEKVGPASHHAAPTPAPLPGLPLTPRRLCCGTASAFPKAACPPTRR